MPLLLVVCAAVVAVDRASKHLVVTNGGFHVINSRRGWGSRRALAIRAAVWLVVAVTAGALAARSHSAALQIAAGAVVGGMAGNLIDAKRGRGVTDFIDLRVWPVFNLADVAIVGGTLLAAAALLAV